ncbi:PSD1 and planctomycete cytochrome C domain-containing protein [Stieleria sp. JC731]|uniref:PSD1 and planctomycete cytochrome C domain-containing protein n=1 Tax=Pirellulaceae TaxID=2691357 RepID=UPI001E58B014|nr:PSD1 and planctomycete cytochrome C domain-containing protein [Stieleria sp. JC731]MCC9602835.1 PSD1 and planctomycete cytochrome C domain-containing protein [Stieleria sp. JC731]
MFPILKRACFECHGDTEQAGGLRIDNREDFEDSGIVDSQKPDESELIRRIELPAGHDEIMPAIGDPLSKTQRETLRNWISQGGVWPQDFIEPKHWSYQQPIRSTLPAVSDSNWPRTPLDYFILGRLDENGIRPSALTSPEKLVRRLYLDLIGLPPEPSEIDDFLADPSERRLVELVDQLLARPEFGQRWARQWLDLARYADSHGFQRDNLRDIWAYRDWVIQALNDDMPYDQFTVEQIAGDLLPGATESQRIATGFHRCTPTNVEAGSLPEETRIEQVIDRVNTTGAVWLGTTLECCQCHDHKYDPFSAKEYYQLLAFFNSTEMEADRENPKTPSSIKFNGPSMPLSDPKNDAIRDALNSEIDGLKRRKQNRRDELVNSFDDQFTSIQKRISKAPTTHPMRVVDFHSEGTTDEYETLDDGSVLLRGGDPPAKDTYTVTLETDCEQINAIRLDVLTDPSLPMDGPGRSERRNFVLHEFTVQPVSLKPLSDKQVATRPVAVADSSDEDGNVVGKSLEFKSAKASFSQKKWDVFGAVDGKPKTGWAISPEFGKPHWATFVLKKPVTSGAASRWKVVITQQFGRSLNIGRFKISAIEGDVQAEPIPKAVIVAAAKSLDQLNKKDRDAILDYVIASDKQMDQLDKQIDSLVKQRDANAPETTLVMIELDQPRMTNVFNRGDYLSPGEPVVPGVPQVLHDLPAGPPNRLTLARWLVSPENPLAARVAVNRWWEQIFGRGLVGTPEDFGVKGDLPSHPKLLDWLALELMDNDWSMKHVLKQIVLSSTYRQSSVIRYDLDEIDPENRLLARGARFRMDAEMVRDNALSIAGLLDRSFEGPSIRPYQPDDIWSKVGGTAYDYEVSPGSEQYRRGVYVVIKRGSPYPSFLNFDATARLTCTVTRGRTNTPLQALTLLNDQVYVDAAKSLASRIKLEAVSRDPNELISTGFRLCTAREPNPSELATLTFLLEKHSDQDDPFLGVATVLLNLHETITKD